MILTIMVIADSHGSKSSFKWLPSIARRFDVIVMVGDAANWGNIDEFKEFYRAISTLGLPTIYVRGNHDPAVSLKEANIVDVHGRTWALGDVTFAGLGGSNPTPFNTPFEMDDSLAEGLLTQFTGKLDVVVSHAPPFGTRCDQTVSGQHVGSRPVRKFVEERRPRVLTCGHIHESRSIDRLGTTWIVNPGPVSQGNYAIIELKKDVHVELGREIV